MSYVVGYWLVAGILVRLGNDRKREGRRRRVSRVLGMKRAAGERGRDNGWDG